MSNYPHSTTISSSLSTSPYAVHSNLESLIHRSKSHQQLGGHSDSERSQKRRHSLSSVKSHLQAGEVTANYSRHRLSAVHGHRPTVDTIQEVSHEDPLVFQDEDDNQNEHHERAGLLAQDQAKRGSRHRRRSYGATSALLGPYDHSKQTKSSKTFDGEGSQPKSTAHVRNKNDQLRSEQDDSSDDESIATQHGRPRGSHSLSRVSSHHSAQSHHYRKPGAAVRATCDSSDDEGDDLVRGILANADVVLNGGRAGDAVAIDFDPVEELDAVDLELPLTDDGTEARDWPKALRASIFPIILRTTLPIFFTQVAEWSLVLASVVSIGHLGTIDLAASSLASMTAAVSCYSTLQGLGTSLDTLLPAAWTSSDPSRVGLWTQRAFVVMSFSMIPMFLFWWNVTPVLIVLGQDVEVSFRAGLYLRWLSLGIPGYGGNVLVRKYLQSQNLMHVPTYTLFFVAPINLFMNWLFVWGPDSFRLGFAGGALATAISYNLVFLISGTWALLYGHEEAYHPISFKHAFSKLGTIASLGFAGTIMLSAEWWAWEVCALAASLLGPTHLAAQSVLLSTASSFFQVPASLGIASAVRVGNLLGAGRGWEAKWASRACLTLSVTLAIINSLICIFFRKNWAYLFNSDPEVVKLVASVMPFIGFFQITDGLTTVAGAILRSLGLYKTGALINLTSYYMIGLPFGFWLCFSPSVKLGLSGLWIGLSTALVYACLASTYLVWRADWTRAVQRVRERLGLDAHGLIGADGKWDEREPGEPNERERLLE
nr:MATE family multidrug resistance protein [Cryptococcus depauperatus CBS 7855]